MQSPRFPCKQALRVFRGVPHVHVAVLWHTFGDDRSCLRRLFGQAERLGQATTIEIHPTCGPCRRNRNHAPEIVPGSRRRIRQITSFAERHAGHRLRFLLSLELEDQFSAAEAASVLATVRAEWPFDVVRNPIRTVRPVGVDYIELHGAKATCTRAGQSIVDLDGDDIGYDQMRAFIAKSHDCAFVRLWRPEWQGLETERFVSIARRHYVISRRDIFELRKLL